MTAILGIETSCDETSAAVVVDGVDVWSNVVASQVDLHAKYGGVVPEIASRAHIERLRESSPDLRAKGLEFGGLVNFEDARLIAIEIDEDPDFDDYIAITGRLVVNKP